MKTSEISTFPAQAEVLTPDELYILFKQNLPTNKNHQYITGPINSGGARRKYSFENASREDLQLMVATIIKENVQFANIILNSLVSQRQLEPNSVVTTPYKLGKRSQPSDRKNRETSEWQETEYLLFWSMVVAGISEEYAPTFYANSHSAMLNNPAAIDRVTLSRKTRIPHFLRLEKIVREELFKAPEGTVEPISSLVTFPDAHYSLGSTFEQRLARYLNIPSKQVIFNVGHPFFHTSLIAQDSVFQYLKGVDDGLKIANNDQSFFTIGLTQSNEVPEYAI